MKKTFFLFFTVIMSISLLIGCSNSSEQVQNNPEKTFTVLSGSENKPIEPMLSQFAKDKGYTLKMDYKGSVDSMLDLQNNAKKYDAIWLPNSMWIRMGDTKKVVKDEKSIFTSPVVFGIKKSKAKELGFIGKDVMVEDILQAVKTKKLNFMMTSASQSNSGASAYIGFLYALLGNPETITREDLHKPKLKEDLKSLLSGINRTSDSSGWLKEFYLKGNYDAMVNYEAVMIETNQELLKQGKEPLYLIYPKNGLTISDNTLGYIDNKNDKKEQFFKTMQDFLLNEKTQNKISDLGRRTGYGGIVKNPNPKIFNPDWGIQTNKPLSPIKFPSEDVIREALTLYQTAFKKASYTIFALDYSTSMQGTGEKEMKEAISFLLDQNKAKKYLLQSSNEDKIVVIPFSNELLGKWNANNVTQYNDLLKTIKNFSPNGGTDIYAPVEEGMKILNKIDMQKYNPSIILMTDGQSDGSIDNLKSYYQKINKDIPVFSVMFGDAEDKQLNAISELTRGRTFDGKNDLIGAFKSAKGYN